MYDFESDRRPEDRAPQHPLPHRLLGFAEAPRLLGELSSSLVLDTLSHATGSFAADGAGRPVLVLPGFRARDLLTFRLRSHLRGLGYAVHGWGLGANVGFTDRLIDGVLSRLDEIADRAGQPVSVVGWSFGGLSARWLAHERPDSVRQVLTLGSPWRREGEITRSTPMFERSAVTHGLSLRARDITARLREPLPVMSTAVWSRSDGIVSWQGCTVGGHDPIGEDIEVHSSHTGLVSNPQALAAVADRLAQDPADPTPFAWGAALRRAAGHADAPAGRRAREAVAG